MVRRREKKNRKERVRERKGEGKRKKKGRRERGKEEKGRK